MTKKEKKDLALQIKAEIEAKKPKPEPDPLPSKKNLEQNNDRRYRQGKAKQMKGVKQYRKPKENHFDPDPW